MTAVEQPSGSDGHTALTAAREQPLPVDQTDRPISVSRSCVKHPNQGAVMSYSPDLHRCRACGRIAEWHYVVDVNDGGVPIPSYRRAPGTKCYSPGEGTTNVQPHILDPDMSAPIDPSTLALRSAVA